MNVALRQLESFLAVAEELNFSRAARRLNMTQPPLTRQIQLLESELGVVLLKRTQRLVELTDAGTVFLRDVRALIQQLEAAIASAQIAGRGEGGHLSVGFEGVAVYDLIPRSVKAFQNRFPAVTLTLHDMTSAEQSLALHAHRISVGFVSGTTSDRKLACAVLLSESVVLALPAYHPLSSQKLVRLKDLANEQILMCPRHHNPAMYDQLLAMCHRAGFAPKITHQPAEMQLVLSFIASGLGIAIVPAAVQKLNRSGVVYRPLRPAGPQTALSLITMKNNNSLLVSGFRDLVTQMAKSPGLTGVALGES